MNISHVSWACCFAWCLVAVAAVAEEASDPQWIQQGRIGLRHMATRQLVYKNFRVEQLGTTKAP